MVNHYTPLRQKSGSNLHPEPAAQIGLARQVLISIGVIFTVAAIIVGNLPDSALKAHFSQWTQPYLNFTGLYQDWSVFAHPRSISAYIDARVDYSDGTSSVYPVPAGRGPAAYRDYHWNKFQEYLRTDGGRLLWPAYARYVADRARDDGRNPVRVTLVRRWADTAPPGPGPEHGPWHEFTMYVMPIEGAR